MGCIYSGKYLSSICLVGEMSVEDVTGRRSVRRGCVWSGMCLVGEMSVGEVSVGEESVGKRQSGMCLGIINLYTKVLEIII